MGGGGNMLYPGIPSTVLGYEISTEWCPTFNGAVMNDTMYTQYVDRVSKPTWQHPIQTTLRVTFR